MRVPLLKRSFAFHSRGYPASCPVMCWANYRSFKMTGDTERFLRVWCCRPHSDSSRSLSRSPSLLLLGLEICKHNNLPGTGAVWAGGSDDSTAIGCGNYLCSIGSLVPVALRAVAREALWSALAST